MQRILSWFPRKMKERLPYIDLWVTIPYILLSILGIVMVYSASADFYIQNGISAKSYLLKQAVWVMVGLVITFLIFAINKKGLRNKRLIQITSIVLIIVSIYLVLFGSNTNGATGWIYIGSFGIQPAEYLKLFIILYLSNILSLHQNRIELGEDISSKTTWSPAVLVGFLIVLNFLQHDLGGSVINASIAIVIFLAAGSNYRRSVAGIFIGLASFFVLLTTFASKIDVNTPNYMLQRIVGFAHPFELSKGAGNQLVNSYYALGNGGIFGVGLGNSIQKKGYLPEANTDFIMSVIAEELGLIMVVIIISVLFIIIIRSIIIGTRSTKMYDTLVCYGIATYLVVQTFFNVGGITGLIPITGVTFPFISYGGSSMMVLSATMGVLLNISASQKREFIQLDQGEN
ncbi:FtsW/RodA/SpoVE family cell cycle protein [Pediococcus stilesii]|uniref:Probable peptidoglycan glycosyltransferase FtsW n=1 Tax=Pediococcus stilesii TaxID=331679 RepID=A0A5R9BYQ0_9LACO|nr:FtsW/RodA/SpoVE family cell cycle protein [Pediococcus stilesii]TLQ04972.1 FtsW/RodA/SpoVE family cell cycle protein [Pediococcus stilesii]